MFTFVAIFAWLLSEFHIGTDLWDQKLRRCLVLAGAGGTPFRCPLWSCVGGLSLCASLSSVKNGLYPTESWSPKHLNILIMSPLYLFSTKEVSPTMLSFSG